MFSIISRKRCPCFFGWGYHFCGSSSLTLILATCTKLVVVVPTFSSLMRNLCLSSALLLETCGAALHLPPISHPHRGKTERSAVAKTDQMHHLCHSLSLSLVLLHLPLFSLANIKHVVWKGKSLLLWWRRPHGAARLPDLTGCSGRKFDTHTKWNLFHGLQGHLAIAQEKVRSG